VSFRSHPGLALYSLRFPLHAKQNHNCVDERNIGKPTELSNAPLLFSMKEMMTQTQTIMKQIPCATDSTNQRGCILPSDIMPYRYDSDVLLHPRRAKITR
jgi:hypothetical protein